jgi:hypothetical protein
MKSRNGDWLGYVARIEAIRKTLKILVGIPEWEEKPL